MIATFEDVTFELEGKQEEGARALHSYRDLDSRGWFFEDDGSSSCFRISTEHGENLLIVMDTIAGTIEDRINHFEDSIVENGVFYDWVRGVPIFYTDYTEILKGQTR